MNPIQSIVILMISSASLAFGQNDQEKLKIEQEVKKLDVEHADAVLRGDQEAMNKYWTEDFIVANPSFIRESEVIKVHGNTVIVMGKETMIAKGKSPDAGKTINRRYTNTWMQREGNGD